MEEFTRNSKLGDMHIYSWGFSKYGQTGVDNCQYTDEPNMLFVPLIKEIVSIYTGEFNSSFIFKDNGAYLYEFVCTFMTHGIQSIIKDVNTSIDGFLVVPIYDWR